MTKVGRFEYSACLQTCATGFAPCGRQREKLVDTSASLADDGRVMTSTVIASRPKSQRYSIAEAAARVRQVIWRAMQKRHSSEQQGEFT